MASAGLTVSLRTYHTGPNLTRECVAILASTQVTSRVAWGQNSGLGAGFPYLGKPNQKIAEGEVPTAFIDTPHTTMVQENFHQKISFMLLTAY